MSKTPAKWWNSRTWVTLRSGLSWTHWRLKRHQRWTERYLSLLQAQEEQTLRLQRALLWEALQPMAEALHRLDQQQKTEAQHQYEYQKYLESLLMEVLNSLQPSAQDQLLPAGLSMQLPSSPSSGN